MSRPSRGRARLVRRQVFLSKSFPTSMRTYILEGRNSIPQVRTHCSHGKSIGALTLTAERLPDDPTSQAMLGNACETNDVPGPSSPYPAPLAFDREFDEVSMGFPRTLTVVSLNSGGDASAVGG